MAPGGTGTAEFVSLLATLSGDAFQEAVCGHLGRTFDGFQNVPAAGGDGGLDGLSHNGTIAYCCYGPTDAHSRRARDKAFHNKIVKKFRGDLRRIFELATAKKKLIDFPNTTLAGVMGAGRKITVIRLLLNRFDDPTLIGSMSNVLEECVKASTSRFVNSPTDLTIWGPKELAQHVPPTESTLFRLQEPAVAAALASSDTEQPAPSALTTFDDKFDDLLRRRKGAAVVDEVRASFRSRWTSVLAFEKRLSTSAPAMHQRLDAVRHEAALAARRAQLGETMPDASASLETARTSIADALEGVLKAGLDHTRKAEIADGEVARLVGDCAIEWRRKE